LNVRRVSDVWKIQIHIAEPLEPDYRTFEVETASAKFRKYKSPVRDQIQTELIQTALIIFEARKNCLTCGRSLVL
jgi:hypothetical protein